MNIVANTLMNKVSHADEQSSPYGDEQRSLGIDEWSIPFTDEQSSP